MEKLGVTDAQQAIVWIDVDIGLLRWQLEAARHRRNRRFSPLGASLAGSTFLGLGGPVSMRSEVRVEARVFIWRTC